MNLSAFEFDGRMSTGFITQSGIGLLSSSDA